MNGIGQKEFQKYMNAAGVLTESASSEEEIDYIFAYCYGLRRCYHGEDFGSEAIIATMILRGEASKDGFDDGLLGKPADWSRFRQLKYQGAVISGSPLLFVQHSADGLR